MRKLLNNKGILVLTLTRFIYAIFFALEAYPSYNSDGSIGPIIRVDEISCLTMVFFGYSNGYSATMSMS